MSTVEYCSACDRALPADAPFGLCPACLLITALADETTLTEYVSHRAATGRVAPGAVLDAPAGVGLIASTENSHPCGLDSTASTDPEPTRSFTDARTARGRDGVDFEPEGYEILGVLGRGGTGIVYRAHQRDLDRPVALKVLHGDGPIAPGRLERFRFEGQAVARLNHSNIVKIHVVDEDRGRPFFAMELLDGGTLKEKLSDELMPPRRAAELTRVLALAVRYAHERGIIHRDLKPSNVIFDGQGTPKIVDFGLAKSLDSDTDQTLTGQVMGTPPYMAPEQARGENRALGSAVDVYALGAILYECLTGRPPFKGATGEETLRLVVREEPIAPSRFQRKVPRDLETICLKCLEKAPGQRYPSAGALADDLGRFLDDEAILARRPPAAERVSRWARRRPTAATLLAVGVVAAVVAGLAAERTRRESLLRATAEARLRREAFGALGAAGDLRARGALYQAEGDLKGMLGRLRDNPRLTDVRGLLTAELRRVEGALRRAEGERAAAAAREARRAEALDRLERFRRLRDETLFRDSRLGSVWRDPMSFGAGTSEDRQRQTRATAAAALALFAAPGGDGLTPGLPVGSLSPAQDAEIKEGYHLVLTVLSGAVADPLPGEDPDRQAAEALRLLDRAEGLRPASPALHLRRADWLERRGDSEAAEAARARAAALQPADAFDHLLLGLERARAGAWDAALGSFRTAAREQPGLFQAHCLLATAALNSTPPRPDEARAALTVCLAEQQSYAWLYLLRGFANGLARGVAAAGSAAAVAAEAEAEADFRRAMELGLDDGSRYALLMNRGAVRYLGGRCGQAAADFRAAVALDPGPFNAHASLAQALRCLGRNAEAVEAFDRAVARNPGLAALYRGRALARWGDRGRDRAATLAAIDDLAESARRAPPGSRAAAEDHARRAQLLLELGDDPETLARVLDAADTALAVAPDVADAHLAKFGALLGLGRHAELIRACDAALAHGARDHRYHTFRGMARLARRDFGGAIDDFTAALSLHPDAPEALEKRGWAHLSRHDPEMALRDFEAIVRRAPSRPDGHIGRALALVHLDPTPDDGADARGRMKRVTEGLADVERSLRRAEPTGRTLYIAAEAYGFATLVAERETTRRGHPTSPVSLAFESRAADLLGQALRAMPTEHRARFWQEVVAHDPDLGAILRNPTLVRRLRPAEPPR